MTIIEQTTAVNPQQRPRRSRRRRIITLICTPVGAAALAAAGWTVLHDEPRKAATFGCVADGVSSVLANDGTPPVEACRAEWEGGNMLEGVRSSPPLAAGINSRALVEVIVAERPDACKEAGMSEWIGQGDYEAVGSVVVRSARVAFLDRYKSTGNGCATEQDWRTALGEGLQQSGITWTVEVNQVEPDRRCFDVGSLDPTTRIVTLVGVPGDYSIGCDPRTGC